MGDLPGAGVLDDHCQQGFVRDVTLHQMEACAIVPRRRRLEMSHITSVTDEGKVLPPAIQAEVGQVRSGEARRVPHQGRPHARAPGKEGIAAGPSARQAPSISASAWGQGRSGERPACAQAALARAE